MLHPSPPSSTPYRVPADPLPRRRPLPGWQRDLVILLVLFVVGLGVAEWLGRRFDRTYATRGLYLGPECAHGRGCRGAETCLSIDDRTSVCVEECKPWRPGTCTAFDVERPYCARLSTMVRSPRQDAFVCALPFY